MAGCHGFCYDGRVGDPGGSPPNASLGDKGFASCGVTLRGACRLSVSAMPQVAVVMGSESDREVVASATALRAEFGIPHPWRVLSAHRTPQALADFASGAREAGIGIIIAAAGGRHTWAV